MGMKSRRKRERREREAQKPKLTGDEKDLFAAYMRATYGHLAVPAELPVPKPET